MKNKKLWYLIAGIVVILIICSLKIVNDYRERNLVDLITYKPAEFYSLGFIKNEVPEYKAYSWFTKDKEPADELMDFLSQYRVKKISEEEFNQGMFSVEKFEFTITHSKANPAIIFAYENVVHIVAGNYYEIENGPIDMEWITSFHAKYQGMMNDKFEDLYSLE
ncbi:hypothetical protein [Ureibacillus acetophenoni]|uniref:Uncharacterized protein n=1 Tax=Ureibacillus acetophenoni TaxID=614649 RepID=A0A285UQA9_9BACL|nr:hypothetical protein [Ureibacillus acetophenoni]SOC43877.1 hypothetical protein SAMN05877842_11784 [Ureibacillus acetophenoni]